MQWVKYLIGSLVVGYAVWSIWSLQASRYWESAGMLLSGVAVYAIYYFFFRRHVRQEELMDRLEKEGLRVQASILGVHATSTHINENPVMRIKVKYVTQGKEHVQEIKQAIPHHVLSYLQTGKRIPILVHPKRTDQFVLQL